MAARRARVRAPLDPDGPFEVLAAGGGEAVEVLAPAALAARLAGTPFDLFVPGLAGFVTTLRIPARSLATARRAAPWALEERLLAAPAAVRVAVVPSGTEGEWAAWAVGQAWLDGVEARLAEAGLHPQAVRPDWVHLPWQEGEWSLLLNGRDSLLRYGRWGVLSLDPARLESLLVLLLGSDSRPARLRLWSAPAHAGEIAPLADLLGARGVALVRTPAPGAAALRLLITPGGLPTHANGSAEAALILPRRQPGKRAEGWSLAGTGSRRAALLALAAVLALAGVAQQRAALQTHIAATEAAIETSARTALPAGTRLVDPVTQLRQALASGGLAEGFAPMLALAAPLLGPQASPAPGLRALDFTAGRLQLEVLAGEVLSADRLVQRLADIPGVHATLAGVEGTAPRLIARITVEVGPP